MGSKRSNRDRLEQRMRSINNQRAIESELRYFSLSPKCIALLNVLQNKVHRVGNDNFKTLVLVQRRKVAQILSVLINQSPLSIVADYLISSVSKGGAMNAKMTLSLFSMNKLYTILSRLNPMNESMEQFVGDDTFEYCGPN